MEIHLEQKTVNVARALPLRLKDIGKLGELGIDPQKAEAWAPEQVVTFVHYILSKADPSVSREEASEIPVSELATLVSVAMGVTKMPPFGGTTGGSSTD